MAPASSRMVGACVLAAGLVLGACDAGSSEAGSADLLTDATAVLPPSDVLGIRTDAAKHLDRYDIPCGPRREPEDSRAYDAAGEVGTIGKARFRTSYTGLLVCPSPPLIVVFREPNPKLDRALRQVLDRHDLPPRALRFRASAISYADMERIDREIRRKEPELRAAGASTCDSSRDPRGWIRLGVAGDREAAIRILREISARIEVEDVCRRSVPL